jgi:succinate dehydrogenase hydrophobic anchor subunit
MSHIRRNRSQQRKSVIKRHKKRKALGLIITLVLFISIVISTILIILSTP